MVPVAERAARVIVRLLKAAISSANGPMIRWRPPAALLRVCFAGCKELLTAGAHHFHQVAAPD